MLLALTSKYKLRDIILGTVVAIAILNALAVLAGGVVSKFIPLWLIKFLAAGAFLFFAATTLISEDDEEENAQSSKFRFAPLAIFCTFFVAELGDKTQLTAINFAMDNGFEKAIIVWCACSIGLFAADMLGLLLGYFLKSKAPDGFLKLIAFVLFTIFGFMTLPVGLYNIFAAEVQEDANLKTMLLSTPKVLPIFTAIVIAFAGICIILWRKHKLERKG